MLLDGCVPCVVEDREALGFCPVGKRDFRFKLEMRPDRCRAEYGIMQLRHICDDTVCLRMGAEDRRRQGEKG